MADERQGGSGPRPLSLGEIIGQEPAESPLVEVYGDFTDQVRLVSHTNMSLLLGFGREVANPVSTILPYVEVKIGGGPATEDGSRPEPENMLVQVLTLENAGFMLANLAADLRISSVHLAGLRQSSMRPERVRIEQTRYLIAQAAKEAMVAVSQLTHLLDAYPEPEDEAEAPVAKPVRERGSGAAAKGKAAAAGRPKVLRPRGLPKR